MSINKKILVFPAHIWTPWFGALGSKSGFDSIEECYKDKSKYIYAIETGMSSDPEMNWRLSSLDKYSIISFSDIHSFWPWRLGREATVFEKAESYDDIFNAIKNKTFKSTIETNPAYGRYHYDGHRNCNFSCSPEQTKKLNGICPKCRQPLTIGVEYRVEELADREEGFKPKNAKPYYEVLPLHEIICARYNIGLATKKSWEIYNQFIERYRNEFNVLLNISEEDMIKNKFDEKLANLILLNRENKIKVKPGYDGNYGQAVIEEQKKLF